MQCFFFFFKAITYLFKHLLSFALMHPRSPQHLCWGHTASSGSSPVAKLKYKQKTVAKWSSATKESEHVAYVQDADGVVSNRHFLFPR